MYFLLHLDLEKIQCMLRIRDSLIFWQLLVIWCKQTMAFRNPYDGAYATFKQIGKLFFKQKIHFLLYLHFEKNRCMLRIPIILIFG